jgi:hypothetical protein
VNMFIKPNIRALIKLGIAIVLATGCSPEPSRQQVIGTYARSYKGMNEKLTLNTNGTFA